MATKYRLEPLLRIKARARRRAEISLAQAIAHLEREKKRKKELEEEKKDLIDAKREIRAEVEKRMTNQEGVIGDSFRYIDYMKGLDEDVHQKDRDLERQEEVIEDATIIVSRARRDYIDAAQEHKVMEKHKELWAKRQQKELARREQKELDELGQVIHQLAQRSH